MRGSLVFLLALGCGDGSSTTDDTTDTGSADTGSTDTGEPPACNAESSSGDTALGNTLAGVIRDADGTPLAEAEIGLCKQLCRTLCTDENGAFSYGEIADDTYSFHVRPPHGLEDELVEVVWPLSFAGETDVTQDVTLIAAPSFTDLPATAEEVEVAPGLRITVGQGDLAILFEDDPTNIGATPIETFEFGAPSGSFVAGWYVMPYEAKSESGLPVRFANDFGAAAGSTLRAWTSSYEDYSWVDLGTFTEPNGFFEADSAAGTLPVLATLVLVDEG